MLVALGVALESVVALGCEADGVVVALTFVDVAVAGAIVEVIIVAKSWGSTSFDVRSGTR